MKAIFKLFFFLQKSKTIAKQNLQKYITKINNKHIKPYPISLVSYITYCNKKKIITKYNLKINHFNTHTMLIKICE